MPSGFRDYGSENSRATDYPALARLRLDDDDWQALARQGFVGHEQRGGRKYWKLRFRRGGRQQVRYVGGDEQARQVTEELEQLQRPMRDLRHLNEVTRRANRALRETKQQTEAVVEQFGFRYHGLRLRKRRTATGRDDG